MNFRHSFPLVFRFECTCSVILVTQPNKRSRRRRQIRLIASPSRRWLQKYRSCGSLNCYLNYICMYVLQCDSVANVLVFPLFCVCCLMFIKSYCVALTSRVVPCEFVVQYLRTYYIFCVSAPARYIWFRVNVTEVFQNTIYAVCRFLCVQLYGMWVNNSIRRSARMCVNKYKNYLQTRLNVRAPNLIYTYSHVVCVCVAQTCVRAYVRKPFRLTKICTHAMFSINSHMCACVVPS